MLQAAIKCWNKKCNNTSDNYLCSLSKHLEHIQGKIMLNPSDANLWLQEQSFQEQFYIAAKEQEI